MRIHHKLKYQQLINLAVNDSGYFVRIIQYNVNGKIRDIREYSLTPDCLVTKNTKFYARMHRVIIKAIENDYLIEIKKLIR